MAPRLDAPRELDIRSVDGLREPLKAELPPLLRLAVDGLRAAELPPALRFAVDALGLADALPVPRLAVDALGLEDALPRLPACAPVPARFEAVADEWPRAWLLVTRLEPELAPCFCATLELL